jgi:ferric-dicitrate binding protein FerR (iron transport regulator)
MKIFFLEFVVLFEKCGDIGENHEMKEIDEIIANKLAGECIDEQEEVTFEEWESAAREGHAILDHQETLLETAPARARYLANPLAPLARILRAVAIKRFKRRAVRWGSAAAACILLVWGGTLFLPGNDETRDPAPDASIHPGTPRAQLKREGARGIHLGPGEAAVLPRDAHVEIRDADNTLTYATRGDAGKFTRDTLLVPHGGEYTLVLADGTRVYLNAASELIFPSRFLDEGPREVHLRGEAYFEVEADATRPFIVHTRDVAVRALGTSFNVNARQAVVTTLVSGRVRLTVAGLTREIVPGEQAVCRDGEIAVRAVATELYTSWKDGYYLFRAAPLEEIMTTLAAWYNISVHYAGPAARGVRFSGRLQRFEDIEYLLDKFEETGAVTFLVEGTDITVRHEKKGFPR